MTERTDYRPDIDGLRAVAVLGVVLYHYGAPVPGGFTGVDIFFVISGYLITSIIAGEIEAGTFSVLGFYDRRIRRIVPALLVILAVTLAAGWLLLIPGDYASLGKSALYAAAGLGNFYFLENTGYFDIEADLQPLLHTWSLGVEEQFYVVWPLLLWTGMAIVRSPRLLTILIGLAVALASAYAVRKLGSDPRGAFYLPHPRAWELGLGALLVFLPALRGRALAEAAATVGALLIVWSLFGLTDAEPFPGLNAAYGCLGAALLIWPKQQQTVLARTLSFSPMVWIGLVSYSLYLWHWPMLVLFRHYINGGQPTWIEAAGLGVAAFVVAGLSWRFVERPFRRRRLRPLATVAAGLVSIAVIAGAANVVVEREGFRDRLSPVVEAMRSREVMWDWECPERVQLAGFAADSCSFGAPWNEAATRGVLWGDSHAEHLVPIIDALARTNDTAFVLVNGCPGALGKTVHRRFPEYPDYVATCTAQRQQVLDLLAADPTIRQVVLSAAWTYLADSDIYSDLAGAVSKTEMVRDGLAGFIGDAATPGRRLTIVADMTGPGKDKNLTDCIVAASSGMLRRTCDPGYVDIVPTEREYFLGPMEAALTTLERDGVTVLRPLDTFCRQTETCIAYVNGEFIFRDSTHLRRNLRHETYLELGRLFGLDRVFDTGTP